MDQKSPYWLILKFLPEMTNNQRKCFHEITSNMVKLYLNVFQLSQATFFIPWCCDPEGSSPFQAHGGFQDQVTGPDLLATDMRVPNSQQYTKMKQLKCYLIRELAKRPKSGALALLLLYY